MSLGSSNSPIHNPLGSGDFAVGSLAGNQVSMPALMRLVYLWMGIGLAVTAFIAFIVTGQIQIAMNAADVDSIWLNQGFMIGAIVANLALVIVLSLGITRHWLTPSLAGILFLVYAAINGVTFSWILLSYTDATIFKAFGTAAILFGVMSVYGFTTKSDLSSWGNLLLMGLVGIIIATVLNVFIFRSDGFDLILSIFGVFLFVGLTAYDTQNIKKMAADPAIQSDSNMMLKLSIFGALKLYLDFINLFLYLLRLFGRGER